MSKEGFKNLFIKELKDLYSVETQILEALPKMILATTSQELKEAFQHHLMETETQKDRLDSIFKQLDIRHSRLVCHGMKGILEEGDEIMKSKELHGSVKDAALITAAQRVEHYEIAAYGCARSFAKLLDYEDIAALLQESLNEEGNANKKLTALAEGSLFKAGINEKATSK